MQSCRPLQVRQSKLDGRMECGCRTGEYAHSAPQCSAGMADSATARPAGRQEPGSFPGVPVSEGCLGRGLAREMAWAGRVLVPGRAKASRLMPAEQRALIRWEICGT